MPQAEPTVPHFDVVIVGAGISGIDAAYHLSRDRSRTFCILESRHEIGGTWSLFRYPGIRSDSEMFTLGFPFKPWTKRHRIAQGDEIRQYIDETADAFDIRRHIKFNKRVQSASWDSIAARWTLNVISGQDASQITASFCIFATGYYSYSRAYQPKLSNASLFRGPIVHPQFWPDDLDFKDKRVVVIGSGATAVTLVPALARQGAQHVTMLQRSPSYFASLRTIEPVAQLVRAVLPAYVAHHVLRIRNLIRQFFILLLANYFPSFVRRGLLNEVKRNLPEGYPLSPNFTPTYNPWQQRICAVPDGDMFEAIRTGKADVVTGTIDTLSSRAIRMKNGREIQADIIVEATGLQLELLGGAELYVDGSQVDLATRCTYKGQMFDGVPNLSLVFGYVDASWTLGADLCSRYNVRLLDHMKRNGLRQVRPHLPKPLDQFKQQPFVHLTSGYVQRAKHLLPRSTADAPWRPRHSAFWDWATFWLDDVKRDMRFER